MSSIVLAADVLVIASGFGATFVVFAVGVVIGERRSRSLSSGRRRPDAASILLLEFVLMCGAATGRGAVAG